MLAALPLGVGAHEVVKAVTAPRGVAEQRAVDEVVEIGPDGLDRFVRAQGGGDGRRTDGGPGDERRGPEHPRTALGQAPVTELERRADGPAAAAQFIDLFTGNGTPEEEAAAATERLAPALPITVLLLGMGEDMHIASLFPDNDGTAAARVVDLMLKGAQG